MLSLTLQASDTQHAVTAERFKRHCRGIYEELDPQGGLKAVKYQSKGDIASFARLKHTCPELAAAALPYVVGGARSTNYVETPLRLVSKPKSQTPRSRSRGVLGEPPTETPRPPPEVARREDEEARADDLALCAGAGVGWIEVLEYDGRISFAGGPPTGTTAKPGAVPILKDRLTFQAPVKALIYESEVPCLFSGDNGCRSEESSGDFLVGGRVVFANEVGGRRRWQLCVARLK
jgi:hypothetical protein